MTSQLSSVLALFVVIGFFVLLLFFLLRPLYNLIKALTDYLNRH